MKRFQKVLNKIFRIWLIYVAVSLVLPPLYHKLPAKEITAYEEHKDMDDPERVLSIDNNMDALLWRLRLIESAKETIVLVFLAEETQMIFFLEIMWTRTMRTGISWFMKRFRGRDIPLSSFRNIQKKYGIFPAVKNTGNMR